MYIFFSLVFDYLAYLNRDRSRWKNEYPQWIFLHFSSKTKHSNAWSITTTKNLHSSSNSSFFCIPLSHRSRRLSFQFPAGSDCKFPSSIVRWALVLSMNSCFGTRQQDKKKEKWNFSRNIWRIVFFPDFSSTFSLFHNISAPFFFFHFSSLKKLSLTFPLEVINLILILV